MGSLAVTQVTQSGGAFNLAALGTIDWAHYDLSPALVRKSGGGSLITVTTPGGTPASYNNDLRTFTWTGGTPTASGSDQNGVYLQAGTFTIVVPASPTLQTLHVWCACAQSQARLVATLSDGSAPVYRSRRIGQALDNALIQFSLAFAANSAGQTLTVTWVEEAGASHMFHNTAVAAVALASGDTRPAQTGVLTLAQTFGGDTTPTMNGPAYNANLTDAGSADWVQTHDSLASLNRKSGGGGTITLANIGGGDNPYSGDLRNLSWSDGTPTGAATEGNGSYVVGPSAPGAPRGFQITVPADTTQRRLVLYVGSYQAYGQLVASLSDGSAASVYSMEGGYSGGATAQVFTLVYKAGSAGQTLTVTWFETADFGGNVTICGAATAVYPSAWYPIAHTAGSSAFGGTIATSQPANTIGATHLIAFVGSQNGASTAFSDSFGNTWTKVKSYTNLGVTGQTIEVWTAPATSTGPDHTITATCPSGSNPTVALSAYANATAIPFDQSSAGGAGVASTLQPGALTPGGNDALVLCFSVNTPFAFQQSIGSGYLQETQAMSGNPSLAAMLSERIVATPTALNPTITFNIAPSHAWAAQVSFAPFVAPTSQETSTPYVVN